VDTPQLPALHVRGVTKYFGDVAALNEADLTVQAAEVHGLIGHNGSGKSTLVKTLAGFHHRDGGEIRVGGRPYSRRVTPHEVRSLGIGFVHQDLALIPGLPIVDNLGFSARGFERTAAGLISWRRQRERSARMLERLGVNTDVRREVSTLTPVEQTLVAIARTLAEHDHTKLLVLDEPTARLPRAEVSRLLDVVRAIVQTGTGVLFISHRLDEVLDLCDRITVFREGTDVADFSAEGQTHGSLIREMIGAEEFARLETTDRRPSTPIDPARPAIAELVGVSTDVLDEVSVALRPGEVTVLTGAVGSGIDQVAEVLFGLTQPTWGAVRLAGRSEDGVTVSSSRRFGSAYVSSQRLTEASYSELSLSDNVLLQSDGRTPTLRIQPRRVQDAVRQLLRQFAVRPPAPEAVFRTLSGGNQQKVLIAKWLRLDPRLLILSEPTQGVDPASRFDLYTLTRAASTRGLAVLWLTTDLDEVPKIADRVLIMFEGRLVHDRSVEESSASDILQTVLTGSPHA